MMPRFIVTLLIGACLLTGCGKREETKQTVELIVLTPHHQHITEEFHRAFNKHMGREVAIQWNRGGTGDLTKILDAKNVDDDSFGFDVFFGGGVPMYEAMTAKGYLDRLDLPDDIKEAIPADISGVPNDDPGGRWCGAALSSFGILVNEQALRKQGLPEINCWADLANPRLRSWVVVADPSRSLSVLACYELLLQQYGWEQGFPILLNIFANSRTITDSSSQIPNDISGGNVIAGPCIDFYAYARVAQKEGVLRFVLPEGGVAITPDPIGMLRKPPHREMAQKFIAFVLSEEGQRLWALKPGAEGGPEEQGLYRLPVRRDIYTKYADKIAVDNPYELKLLRVNAELQNQRLPVLISLFGPAMLDAQDDVRLAWKALIDGGMKPEALAEWNKPPFPADELAKYSAILSESDEAQKQQAQALRNAWANWWRAKAAKVTELSR